MVMGPKQEVHMSVTEQDRKYIEEIVEAGKTRAKESNP